MAPVGHASTHRRQFPQEPIEGASTAKACVVISSPMKNQLPRLEAINIVFFPNQPSPARLAKSRSIIGAESTQTRVPHSP